MKVRNENFQEIDLKSLLVEITNEFNANPNVEVSEEEAKEALALLYSDGNLIANRHYLKSNTYAMPVAQAKMLKWPVIDRLWSEFTNWLCPKIDENTEQEKLSELVAEFIVNLVAGAVIIKYLIKRVLFYLFKEGSILVCKNV